MDINFHVIISLILKVTAIKEIRFPCLLVMQVEQRRIMVIMYTIPDANVLIIPLRFFLLICVSFDIFAWMSDKLIIAQCIK